ncbi:MAG: metal transporter, partial [Syntrophales bacterium]
MKNPLFDERMYEIVREFQDRLTAFDAELRLAPLNAMQIQQKYWLGVLTYINDFMVPFWISLKAFLNTEKDKVKKISAIDTILDYLELFQFNLQIAEKGLQGTANNMKDFAVNETIQGMIAWINTIFNRKGVALNEYTANLAKLMQLIVFGYPQAIKAVETEFGFHFDRKGYVKKAETDRFILYQVLPNQKGIRTQKNGKPIIIIPPYVLGANILAFLPSENKSYVHAFANQGIPTYVRIMKKIEDTPAVQVMTGEDDARDTRIFCEKLKATYNKPVTLNGFCQGGFIAVLDILSGELDGLVDALITCVAPMDGTRSISLTEYLQHLPERFRDLGYATKILPNGNRIVDGKVMSWVYKLKSMEKEAPLVALYRDLMTLGGPDSKEVHVSKTAAALNHWIIYDRNDLPENIT